MTDMIILFHNIINKKYNRFLMILIISISLFNMSSCKHEIPGPAAGNGGGGNGNGTGGGNGGGNGIPCDPNVIYFEQQVLPILISSCAKSGCHNSASAQDGVILNSYANVMNTGDVEPFNLGDSEIWEVITESDPDKVMPPPGENPLTQAQINLIAVWINQGAQNLVCDDGLGPCDSVSVSFASDIQPIIQSKCLGCHTTGTSANYFINLSGYNGVAAAASTGQLVGAVSHNPNYQPMPKGGAMLPDCEIAKVKNWISEGALNN